MLHAPVLSQGAGLIGSIYDTAIAESAWGRVLGGLCETFDARAGGLGKYDFSCMIGSIGPSINIDEHHCRSYRQELCTQNPWMQEPAVYRTGAVFTGEEICPRDDLVQTDFYCRFLRPLGVMHRLCGVIARDGPTAEFIALLRPQEAPAFGSGDQKRLKLLLPHFKRSREIRAHTIRHREDRHNLFGVLNHLPVACLIVDRGGRMRFCNQSGSSLIARRDGLMLVGERLGAMTSRATVRLRRIIAETAVSQTSYADPLSGEHVVLPRGADQTPLICVMFPMHGTGLANSSDSSPAVAMLIRNPDDELLDSLDDFAGIYGLTPAEARLIGLLAEGRELNQAARHLGVSRNTARSHMRSVYAKAGVHRQVDLLRLLHRLSVF